MREAGPLQRLVTKEGKKRGRVRKYCWTWALRTVWKALLAIKRVKDEKVSPGNSNPRQTGITIRSHGF